MLITLRNPTTLSIAFAFHPQTVAVIKSLPGTEWDKATKTWSAPLHLLRRLVSLYPEAQVEQACINARLELWQRWIVNMNHSGVFFGFRADGETVDCYGQGVSPVLREHVASVGHILRNWLSRPTLPDPLCPAPRPDARLLLTSGCADLGLDSRRAKG